LITARAVQGLGAAIISPAALSIVTTTFAEGAERNKALGVWGAVAGAGGAVGVLLGGVLTQGLGWEWVLFVNVPIALAAAVVTPMLIVESRSPERHGFDVLGAVTVTAGLPLALTTFLSAGAASALVGRLGVRPTLVTGLTLVAGGLVLFAQIDANGSYLGDVLVPSLLVAAGLGLSFVSQTLAATAGVR